MSSLHASATTVGGTAVHDAPQAPTGATEPRAGVAGIGFGRLVRVELRKLVDTRAGRWLLIAIVAITALVVGIMLFAADAEEMTFGNFVGMTATPQAILLPILGILAVTSEWSQRTGLVTFTLEPRRGRVAGAKLVAALLVGVLAVAVAIAVGALANVLGSVAFGGAGTWDFEASFLGGALLMQLLGVAQGVAFGMVLLNTPAAIVAYLALPTAWSILAGMVSSLDAWAEWLDLGRTMAPLLEGGMTGSAWAHLAVSATVWVLLPLAVGVWRLLRREVK